MAKGFIVSVDLGGTKILAALLNAKGNIVAKSKVSTEAGKGRASMIKKIVAVVDDVLKQGNLTKESVKAICIGIPGSVNPYSGQIGTAPNLGLVNFNIRNELEKYIDIPILIENDVNLAALGIKKFELDGGKAKNVLVVFVGTGIGSALIFDNKIYRGSQYFAGEIGHMIIQKNGPLCGCGHKGCFEAVASRTAIVRNIKRDIKAKKKSKLQQIVAKGKPIKSKSLALAMKQNDPVVKKNVTEASSQIGLTLANITNLLNLDLIVLGGGVIEALDKYMLPLIRESFKKAVLKDAGKGVRLIATKLGDDAALYGGLALVEEIKL